MSTLISQIAFIALLVVAGFFIYKRYKFVKSNILLGRPNDPTDRKSERFKNMLLVAFGQKKMFDRPFAALLHLVVYAGFIIINIELLEIIVDGLTGSHRAFIGLGAFYTFLINAFEILAALVIVACVIFFTRRNIAKLKRFHLAEMKPWPKTDANLILITEVILMKAFLIMNAADSIISQRTEGQTPDFIVSHWLQPIFESLSTSNLELISHFTWWLHIVGILAFIVYLSYSKHLHILLAFPTTYFAKLEEPGRINNMLAVTNEVKRMMDPSAQIEPVEVGRFGVKDVADL
ncbi:MAG: Fe-S oxidoreductase, partial [Bacteroidota bacterium]